MRTVQRLLKAMLDRNPGATQGEVLEMVREIGGPVVAHRVAVPVTDNARKLGDEKSIFLLATSLATWMKESGFRVTPPVQGTTAKDWHVWTLYFDQELNRYHPGGYTQLFSGRMPVSLLELMYTRMTTEFPEFPGDRAAIRFNVGPEANMTFNRRLAEGIASVGLDKVLDSLLTQITLREMVMKCFDGGLVSFRDKAVDMRNNRVYDARGGAWPKNARGFDKVPMQFFSDVNCADEHGRLLPPVNLFTVFIQNRFSPATSFWFMVTMGFNWRFQDLQFDMWVNVVGRSRAGKGCLAAMIAAGFGGAGRVTKLAEVQDPKTEGEAFYDGAYIGLLNPDEDGITSSLSRQTILKWASADPITVNKRYARAGPITIKKKVLPIVMGNTALMKVAKEDAMNGSDSVAARAVPFLCPFESAVQDEGFKTDMAGPQLGTSMMLAAECLDLWKRAYQGRWSDCRPRIGGGSLQMRGMNSHYFYQIGRDRAEMDDPNLYQVDGAVADWEANQAEPLPAPVLALLEENPERYPVTWLMLEFYEEGRFPHLEAPVQPRVVPVPQNDARDRLAERPQGRPAWNEFPTEDELLAEALEAGG